MKSKRVDWGASLTLRTLVALGFAASLCSASANAGDTFSSSTPNYGVWNPGGPKNCKGFVDSYNSLTPQIKAAYAKGDTAKAHKLTQERETFKTKYQQCLDGKLLPPFNVTGKISVPGKPDTYPAPQQGLAAGQAGSLAGGASGGGATGGANAGGGNPWIGSATLPAFTSSAGVRYNPEQLQISIGDYVRHAKQKNYSTSVPLIYGSGQFTHAVGIVDTVARTFTVRQVRDSRGRNVTVSPVVVRLQ